MPQRRLPPLAPLIAAETVARLASFTAAGDELHLTPSAISHRVHQLETWLGFQLFHRNTRSVALTTAGAQFLTGVSDALDSLEATTAIAMEQAGQLVIIRLQTTDSFAARWLVDRLPEFLKQHADTSVRVVTREYTEGFHTAEADMAILYGRGDWPARHCTPLIVETILPVCSPTVAARLKKSRGGLHALQLLHDDRLGTSWHDWLQSARIDRSEYENIDLRGGLHFNHSHLALRAAERGNGILLASWPLVADALRREELVAPFRHQHQTGFGYYLLQAPDPRIRQRCMSLAEWLIAEADGAPLLERPVYQNS